jgi:hypothetical protein
MKTKSVPFISHPRDSVNREREGGGGGRNRGGERREEGEVRGSAHVEDKFHRISRLSGRECEMEDFDRIPSWISCLKHHRCSLFLFIVAII